MSKEITLDELILHDLKNPVSGITGTIGFFLDGSLGSINQEQLQYLANIDSSARKLALMLFELSFIIKAEKDELSINPSHVPIKEILKDLPWLGQLAEKENKTLVENIKSDIIVNADKELSIMIINDLLLNALKQAEQGGQVSLEIKKERESVLFEISVATEGIPSEFISKVFDKNFRTLHPELKNKVSPGLGFYFCKLAVEAQGGKIGIGSTPSKPLRYYFYLPQASILM